MLRAIPKLARENLYSNPDEVFFLIGTAYSNTHVHYLIFLSELGNERRYRISDVYPYLLLKGVEPMDALYNIEMAGKGKFVKEVVSVMMLNPMTGDEEKLTKVVAMSSNNINSRDRRKSLAVIWDEDQVYNARDAFHNTVLNESGYIMGMPYKFLNGKPYEVLDGIDEVRDEYAEVMAKMRVEDRDIGEVAMKMMHAIMPDFSRMAISIDIEIKANHGESMNPELAEAPITSISVTYKSKEGVVETVVFVLVNSVLENDPSDTPSDYTDDTFYRYEYEDEKELLRESISFVNALPHKIIVTYNGDAFDIPYIARRLELHNLPLGVKGYKITDKGIYSRWFKKWEGKYLVDLYEYFNNNNIKTGAYLGEYDNLKLDTVAHAVLGENKYKFEGSIANMSSEELSYYNAKDTQLTYNLSVHDDNFPSFILFFIMRFGNLSLENANRRGVTAWWSGFEYRHLHDLGYYYPNHSVLEQSTDRLKGGLVLDAIPGLYKNVSVFDFSSLYPTVIIRDNICYSTMNCSHDTCTDGRTVQGEFYRICSKRRGFIPSAMSFLREARVNIYKPKSKTSKFYSKLSQFIKIFMNAGFGAMANPGFVFMSTPAAMTITQSGRDALIELKGHVEDENGDVIYGDSVLGTEAVVVKFGLDEPPLLLSIEELWTLGEEKGYEAQTHRTDGKQGLVIGGLHVWDGKTYNRVERLIRHYTLKSIYRSATGIGAVDTTEDHSLVDADGNEFRPEDISRGKEPYSATFPLPVDRLTNRNAIDTTLLLYLFSMSGTASGTYTGYPSQRTVSIHLHERVVEVGKKIWERASPAADGFGAKYKEYTSKQNKTIIKFSSHQRMWAFLRRHMYIGGRKVKPIPSVFALPDEELELVWDFIKVYYRNDPKTGGARWTIKSSSEMVLFMSLAEHFSEDMTVVPQPRGKVYQIRRGKTCKTTVTIVRQLTDFVYDMETEDGTFMAGNILCHNTDSVFVVDADAGAAKRISEKMGIDVENEGTWKLMLQHMKKNYILVNDDKNKIKGLRGKKKDVPQFHREIFAETVDNIEPDMIKEELIEHFQDSLDYGISRLKASELHLDSLKRTQTLSKEVHMPQYVDVYSEKTGKKLKHPKVIRCECGSCYRVITPVVQATLDLMKTLEEDGLDKTAIQSFARKGIIVEYVKADGKNRHVSTVTVEDIDIDHYVEVFEQIFRQLLEPLGVDVKEYLRVERFEKLETWF